MKKKKVKKTKKENEYIVFLKSLWESKRGRSVLFFIGYFLFFIFLISAIRSDYSAKTNKVKKPVVSTSVSYKLDKIKEGNYHFVREEVLNGNRTHFEGDSSDNKTKLIKQVDANITDYFLYNGVAMEKKEAGYVMTVDPYLLPKLTTYNYLSKILKNATFLAKTSYSTGADSYEYEISTTTLMSLLEGEKIDIDDPTNKLTLVTDESDNVVKISYEITPYASYYFKQQLSLAITIEYSQFGEIKKFDIPV